MKFILVMSYLYLTSGSVVTNESGVFFSEASCMEARSKVLKKYSSMSKLVVIANCERR